jgi:hypothetical protein
VTAQIDDTANVPVLDVIDADGRLALEHVAEKPHSAIELVAAAAALVAPQVAQEDVGHVSESEPDQRQMPHAVALAPRRACRATTPDHVPGPCSRKRT